MKIEVDVLRGEQSWDIATGVQTNYLVISVFGIETKVPCTEEQLIAAVRSMVAAQPKAVPPPEPATERQFSYAKAPAPALFSGEEEVPEPSFEVAPRPTRPQLKTVRRPVAVAPAPAGESDDAGIEQG